jgi:uncharacterized protein YidB (DUF937 family)
MGLLDSLLAGGGGQGLGALAKVAAQNPQLVAAAVSMLSSKPGSVGGTGGLGSLIGSLQQGGLGDVVNSWVGTGANLPVDAGKLASALGPDLLSQFAKSAGVDHGQAAGSLASILPDLVNQLTPTGQMPDAASLEGMLGGLLGGLGK